MAGQDKLHCQPVAKRPTLADILRSIRFEKYCNFRYQYTTMSKEEIKYEISKVLDHFSDKALAELLAFLKELDTKQESKTPTASSLNKILSEDKELLAKLAQ